MRITCLLLRAMVSRSRCNEGKWLLRNGNTNGLRGKFVISCMLWWNSSTLIILFCKNSGESWKRSFHNFDTLNTTPAALNVVKQKYPLKRWALGTGAWDSYSSRKYWKYTLKYDLINICNRNVVIKVKILLNDDVCLFFGDLKITTERRRRKIYIIRSSVFWLHAFNAINDYPDIKIRNF